jgi:hypothetical protein
MQRDGGFAMKTLNPMSWLSEKIHQIRSISNRQILIRPHPGQYDMNQFAAYTSKQGQRQNIVVIEPSQSRLVDNLQGAYAAVVFNSSASVAAVCEGVPVFADDPSCVSWAIANKNISSIENTPELLTREQWIYDLAAAHWSDADARAGRIYQKFLPYIK